MTSIPEVQPSAEPTYSTGTCHICKAVKDTLLYCSACDHWFCQDCRQSYFARGLEYIKQLIGGRRKGCCGPV